MSPRGLAATALAAASLLAAAGCSLLEPRWSRRLGIVMELPHNLTSLIAPDTVTRGTPFQITASSFGSSSCNRADGSAVTESPGVYEVRLYDKTAPANTMCTMDLRSFPRTLTVRFDQAGTAEIRVIGRGDGENGSGIRTIRKTVVVK